MRYLKKVYFSLLLLLLSGCDTQKEMEEWKVEIQRFKPNIGNIRLNYQGEISGTELLEKFPILPRRLNPHDEWGRPLIFIYFNHKIVKILSKGQDFHDPEDDLVVEVN